MNDTFKTNLIILLSVLIVFGIPTFIFLEVYQFPKKIDVVRSAITYNEKDPSSFKKTSIYISGTLVRPFLRQHKFVGSIRIDGIDISNKYISLDTYIFEKIKGINSGSLLYHSPDLKKYKEEGAIWAGMIWFDDDFQDINIECFKEMKENVDFIVTADSYEDALLVQQKMRKAFGSGFIPSE